MTECRSCYRSISPWLIRSWDFWSLRILVVRIFRLTRIFRLIRVFRGLLCVLLVRRCEHVVEHIFKLVTACYSGQA